MHALAAQTRLKHAGEHTRVQARARLPSPEGGGAAAGAAGAAAFAGAGAAAAEALPEASAGGGGGGGSLRGPAISIMRSSLAPAAPAFPESSPPDSRC